MSRVLSLLNLAYRFNVHLLKKPFISSEDKGKERFLKNYAADHIFPLGEEVRRCLPALQGCLNCGLCDTVCDTLAASKRHLHAGPSQLLTCFSRNLPDLHLLEEYLALGEQCGACTDCVGICPADVPLKETAALVGAMVALARKG